MRAHWILFLGIIALLSACGGGGGGSSSGYGSPTVTEDTDTEAEATNAAPTFVDFEATVEVNENSLQVTTLEASDSDGDTLTFSLEGMDADAFDIDADSGVISFVSAPDYEAQDAYALTVVVSDGSDQTSESLAVNIVDIAEESSEAPLEINVVVSSGSNGYGSGNKYFINGSATASPDLSLEAGMTYRFLQSDSTNATHPLRLSTTANGTHGGGTAYVTGVSYVGTAGSAGAYVQFIVPASGAPDTLYFYCSNHSGMGGTITVTAASGSGYRVIPMN